MATPRDSHRPRLGERDGLQIELDEAVVFSYRRSRERSARIALPEAEAREELETIAGESYIVATDGDVVITRARVRRLEVDATCRFVRTAPDVVRMIACTVRRLDTSRGGSGRSGDAFRVRGLDRRTLGFLRARQDGMGVEWREVGQTPDGPAPPWGHVPAHIVELAREHERAGYPALLRWLERHGAA